MADWIAYNQETGEIRDDANINFPEDVKKKRQLLSKQRINVI